MIRVLSHSPDGATGRTVPCVLIPLCPAAVYDTPQNPQ
jgi:hypothetical protein